MKALARIVFRVWAMGLIPMALICTAGFISDRSVFTYAVGGAFLFAPVVLLSNVLDSLLD